MIISNFFMMNQTTPHLGARSGLMNNEISVDSPGWALYLHLSRGLTYGRLGRASELKKKN
jgi:hypothetical protein